MKSDSPKAMAENRKAWHDYFIFDKFEAGMELVGSEVKSIRDGQASLRDAYIRVTEGEVFVVNLHITPYKYTHSFIPEPTRTRKLLLRKHEIEVLSAKMAQKGFVCVALKMYFKRNFVKMEIALAKKKKQFDKRRTLRETIQKREVDIAMKRAVKKNLN